MNKPILKSTLAAAAISLSLLAPTARAQAPIAKSQRDTGVGLAIAMQGDAALRLIRHEMLVAVRVARPAPLARPRLQVVDVQHGQAGNDPVVTLVKN